jgi:hypothetical protein
VSFIVSFVSFVASTSFVIFVASGCRSSNDAAPQQGAPPQSSVPSLPDISALAPEIQQQIRNDYTALTAIEQDSVALGIRSWRGVRVDGAQIARRG